MSKHKITIWERSKTKFGRYEHNHIEDGWSRLAAPLKGYTDKQVNEWQNYHWRKIYAYLIDGHVNISCAQEDILLADNFTRIRWLLNP